MNCQGNPYVKTLNGHLFRASVMGKESSVKEDLSVCEKSVDSQHTLPICNVSVPA
jgi:hypothetical protein